jgi:nucleotide-binding universal stress UspA family protein
MAPTRIQLEHILCPTDFSDFSARALERTVGLAGFFEAVVTALHVFPFAMPAGPGLPYFPLPAEATRTRREEVQKELQAFVEPFLGRGVGIDTKLREGDPAREIEAEAKALPADLLVMGTHGRSGFEHLLLGSVTEKVLRRVACPVLTVGQVGPQAGSGLFRRILCAADLTEDSRRTVDLALSLAEENGAELTLFHVIESLPGEAGARLYLAVPEIGPLRRDLERRALLELRRMVSVDDRDFCEISEKVTTGSAWREILKLAGEIRADLIVMGAHVRGPIGRLFFGSTSSHVVRQAPCPVLIARQVPARRRAGEAREAEAAAPTQGRGR